MDDFIIGPQSDEMIPEDWDEIREELGLKAQFFVSLYIAKRLYNNFQPE